MASSEDICTQALQLLREANDTVERLTPTQERDVKLFDVRPLSMFWRLFSRSQAICILLENRYVDEAVIILRSNIGDAQRLLYLAQNPSDRKSLVLNLEAEDVRHWEDLAEIEEWLDKDASDLRDKIRRRKAQIENARQRHGVGKKRKFPPEGKGLAVAVKRRDDLIGYKMYTISAHGQSLSPVMQMVKSENGKLGVFTTSNDPYYIVGAAHSTIEYLFEGALAAATMQDWDSLPELKMEYESIDGRFSDLTDQLTDSKKAAIDVE